MLKSAHSFARFAPRYVPVVALTLLVGMGACRADQEALNPPGTDVQVELGPNPAIEQAPAYPTPPVGIPVGGTEPPADPAPVVDMDTIRPAGAPGTAQPQQPGTQQPGAQQPGAQRPGTQTPPATGQPRSP